jgi:hypothetical protein
MKSILDPSFRYTPSIATDLRKTFERIRRDAMPGIAKFSFGTDERPAGNRRDTAQAWNGLRSM